MAETTAKRGVPCAWQAGRRQGGSRDRLRETLHVNLPSRSSSRVCTRPRRPATSRHPLVGRRQQLARFNRSGKWRLAKVISGPTVQASAKLVPKAGLRRKPAIIADRHPHCVVSPAYPPRRSSAHSVSSCGVKLKLPLGDCLPAKRNIIPIMGDSPAAKFKYSYADALFSRRMIYA